MLFSTVSWTFGQIFRLAAALGGGLLAFLLLGAGGPPVASAQVQSDSTSEGYAISFHNIPLSEALPLIARKTKIDLAYPSGLVVGHRTSCRMRSADAEILLDCVLEDTVVEYLRSSGETYVLRKESRQSPRDGQISGTVVDADTREPLPGANVFIDGGTQGTATDDRGRFRLAGLKPGQYAVVASMVGYQPMRRTVILRNPTHARDDAPSLRFELRPDPVDLEGVTVEGSREKWLKRLDEFRKAFFGTVSNAEKCSFVNPEVLAFEENGDALVAHAERPLRIRNAALGYEMTYHLSRYELQSERRMRFGFVEFDTLEAQSPAQRRAWREARRETYRGSFDHFIDALRTNTFRDEGFTVAITDETSSAHFPRGRGPAEKRIADAREILRTTGPQGLGLLVVPDPGDLIKVTYTDKRESRVYARLHRRGYPPRDRQISWLQFFRAPNAIVNLRTGGVLQPKSGYFLKKGYWGWYETTATELPGTYRPPSAR